jgi:hypothetical protein
MDFNIALGENSGRVALGPKDSLPSANQEFMFLHAAMPLMTSTPPHIPSLLVYG